MSVARHWQKMHGSPPSSKRESPFWASCSLRQVGRDPALGLPPDGLTRKDLQFRHHRAAFGGLDWCRDAPAQDEVLKSEGTVTRRARKNGGHAERDPHRTSGHGLGVSAETKPEYQRSRPGIPRDRNRVGPLPRTHSSDKRRSSGMRRNQGTPVESV
jgi:hypothetical protein